MGFPSQEEITHSNTSHPPALPILFFTEMWERFSYYGMRALLVLYAIKHLHFSDGEAGRLYGAYTGFVYLTPIIGGYLADKFLGFRRSILIGCVLMGLGHLSLAIEDFYFFYSGLVLLVIGNGFFKPNMSCLVGSLYEKDPDKKDTGYTIFYMGINLGGFLGPIACGFLGEEVGWHYGFGAAGIGMGIGLLIFIWGSRFIPGHIGRSPILKKKSPVGKLSSDSRGFLTREEEISNKKKIRLIFILSLFSIFFWTAFEQAGSSMNIFADRYVDRFWGGVEIPASVFQSANPVFILVFAPIFAWFWGFLGKKGKEPHSSLKFSMGLFLLAIGFMFLVLGARDVSAYGKTGVIFLLLAYLFNTWGELCLSPVGLSMVSKNAPEKWTGILMGTWFMSNAVSHILGGFLAGYMESWGLENFFSLFVVGSLFASFLLYITDKMRIWD